MAELPGELDEVPRVSGGASVLGAVRPIADSGVVSCELSGDFVWEQSTQRESGCDGFVFERLGERCSAAAIGVERLARASRLLFAYGAFEASLGVLRCPITLASTGGGCGQSFEDSERPDLLPSVMGLEADAVETDVGGRADATAEMVVDAAVRFAQNVDDVGFDLDRDLSREVGCGLLLCALDRVVPSLGLGESAEEPLLGVGWADAVSFDPFRRAPGRGDRGAEAEGGEREREKGSDDPSPSGAPLDRCTRSLHVGKSSGSRIRAGLAPVRVPALRTCRGKLVEFRWENGLGCETNLDEWAT